MITPPACSSATLLRVTFRHDSSSSTATLPGVGALLLPRSPHFPVKDNGKLLIPGFDSCVSSTRRAGQCLATNGGRVDLFSAVSTGIVVWSYRRPSSALSSNFRSVTGRLLTDLHDSPQREWEEYTHLSRTKREFRFALLRSITRPYLSP